MNRKLQLPAVLMTFSSATNSSREMAANYYHIKNKLICVRSVFKGPCQDFISILAIFGT